MVRVPPPGKLRMLGSIRWQSTPSTWQRLRASRSFARLFRMDLIALTKKYFEVWNAHDVDGIKILHAEMSKLKDWDAEHGPTNEDVAKGIGGIWTAVPAIKIEIVDIYLCGAEKTCVANIKVIVDAETTLKVCDVIEYDDKGLVVSLNAYKAD